MDFLGINYYTERWRENNAPQYK
ncbi:MAG TPA: hypothetical protein VNS08_00935 [Ureibacillus sp.]|nr:hypothetical protein [Ureibacillus sp.]